MIIAILSRKGGVGKTTTSVSLAAALAERGKRILLVDLDPQASTSRSLGVPRADLAPSIADVLLRQMPVERTVRPTRVRGLDLITASADLNQIDSDLHTSARKETLLRDALENIKEDYDFVFLDCPPSLSLLACNGLTASNAHLVPANPHFLALEGLENLLPAIERVCHRNGTHSELLGVLLTLVDYRANLTRENVASIREKYGDRVLAIEIRVNIRLAEAPQYASTIFELAPNSTGSECYRLLAEEFLLKTDRVQANARAAASASSARSAAPVAPEPERSRRGRPMAPKAPVKPSRPINPLMPIVANDADEAREVDRELASAWLEADLTTTH
jgi:chromosome partitioning protein